MKTPRQPKDRAFNKMIHEQTEMPAPDERVLFVDTANQIREAVYVSEFESGELQRVRERLEDEGVLKAVVHVAALTLGKSGPRTTVVEYIPDRRYYSVLWTPPKSLWVENEDAVENAKRLFGNGDEEGEGLEET